MSNKYNSVVNDEHVSFLKSYNSDNCHTAYVRTFGCQQNESDSEKICGILKELGYEISNDYRGVDLIILNTCAVRELAENKVFSLLGNFKAEKRKNPSLIIGVVGCMGAIPETVDTLKRDFHYVSFTLGAGVMHKIPSALYEILNEESRRFITPCDKEPIIEDVPVTRTSGHRAYVSIMYGCNNFCSYCIVPYTRGRERSREYPLILDECRTLVDDGVREITLLGQNVNSYRSEIDFPTLLEKVALIDGDFTVKFMTSHPKDVSPRLIEIMSEFPDKIAPYFHLPLQSGSDRILKDMNRTYTREHFMEIADSLKRSVKGINLTTDVIVGYPGETEDDFEKTLDVLRYVKFDAVYAFLYSARAGTVAAKRTDTVSEDVKHERISKLLAMQDEYSLSASLAYVDTVQRVLVDSYSSQNGLYTGRTLSGRLVHFSADNIKTGDFTNVRIERATAFDLYGKR